MTDYSRRDLHRDNPARDREAAGAFSLRTMTAWQLWSITLASAVVVIGLIAYAASL